MHKLPLKNIVVTKQAHPRDQSFSPKLRSLCDQFKAYSYNSR